MKKTATKISGFLTLICAIFLFIVSSLCIVISQLQIEALANIISSLKILQIVYAYFYYIFVAMPILLIGLVAGSITFDSLELVVLIVFVVFSAFMIFCGIKEILISNRDDEGFAHCKKTCWFFSLTKFMFFAYVLFLVIGGLAIDKVKLLLVPLELILVLTLNLQNATLIFTSVVAAIALVLFLLPLINVCYVAKKVKNGYVISQGAEPSNQGEMQGDMQNGAQQNPNQFYQTTPQPTMQANMPPVPGFANANLNTQPAAANPADMPQQPNIVNNPTVNTAVPPQQPVGGAAMPQPGVAPQENTVILNAAGQPLSEKGQADLSRLERLKAMGSITDENYETMKKKILEDN